MASGSRGQSDSEASSDTTDSSSNTSVESTTTDSETTTSLTGKEDGDFLHEILQDLSMSLDTTHTGGTDNASKESAKSSSGELESSSNASSKSQKKSTDEAPVPTKAGKNEAIKTGSKISSDDSETEEESEQKKPEETEQLEADETDGEEKEKTEETEEDTNDGDDAAESELSDADLIIKILRERAGPEPEVILPPFRSKTTKHPPQSRTVKDKTTTSENQVTVPVANPLIETIQYSLFQSFFGCTTSNTVKEVDEKGKIEEEAAESLDVSNAADPVAGSCVAEEKDKLESETKKADTLATAVTETPLVEADENTSKIEDTAVESTTDKGVDSAPEEVLPQDSPKTTEDSVLPVNEASLDAISPEAHPLSSRRSTEDRNSFKNHLEMLKETYSMPLNLSLTMSKSGEWFKQDNLRTVFSVDTGLASTDVKSSKKKLKPVLSNSIGFSRHPGQDALSEPLAIDVFKMLQSVNENKETGKETTGKETKIPLSSSGSKEKAVAEAAIDEQPTVTEIQPETEEEAPQKEAATENDSADMNDDAIVSHPPSQPVVRLAHRLKNWTGKKTKRKNKESRRPMELDSSGNLGANTLKPRRRRKKSRFLRSLTRYVRTKPTLPAISEKESEDSESAKEKDFAYHSEVQACLSEVVACLSGMDGTAASQPGTTNDIESEKDGNNGDACTLEGNAEEGEQVQRSECPENVATDPVKEKRQPSSPPSRLNEETNTSQGDITPKSGVKEAIVSDASVKEPMVEIFEVTNEPKGVDIVEEEKVAPEAKSASDSPQGEQLGTSPENSTSQDKHPHRDTAEIEEKLSGPTRSILPSGSRTSHAIKGETGTELTWEMHKDAVETEPEDHPDFSKADIEEEEDGFSLIMKGSYSGEIEAEEAKADSTSLQSSQRDAPKVSKKSVPGRIRDFLEKKPEAKKASAKKEHQVSTPVASVGESTQPEPKRRKHKQGKKVFAKSASFLKSIKGGAHGKSEGQEIRDQPPPDEFSEGSVILSPADLIELRRWDSVEEKINESLKKVKSLANHYGEDVHHLLEQNDSRVTTGLMDESLEFTRSASLPGSASQEWRVVEERIDESLLKVERLANRLGVSHEFLSSE